MTTTFQALNKGNVKAHTKAIKDQGISCSRPDGLRVSLDALYIRPEWNIRNIDANHVKQLKTAFSNGTAPAPFKVQPCLVNNEERFAVLGGHHTHIAITELIAEGNVFTENSLFDADAVFPKNEAEAIMMAFNHNQGKAMTVIQNARVFKRLQDEGMELIEIVNKTGHSKSVICNSVKLLEGDDELIQLVEDNKISATRARNFINKHGSTKATQYALADIGLRTQPVSQEPVNTEAVDSDNNQPTRLAAKVHAPEGVTRARGGLREKNLAKGKIDEMESLIKYMSTRIDADGNIHLPEAMINKVKSLADAVEKKDEHNARALEAQNALAE
ncbi:hypothetical protein PVK62_07985 [Aliivibrio sp. S3MY1]|uniref:hypothetical protein n=1 Tax=unclassified Aliivibrio TaxID=2645654 RepID=UPI002378E004|nr:MULTISPECIES: hypothetical protein [unclassified Aliivibrio]MDD9176011.1 hypothetical protein [Aliivibrio sp. S3TY1]MDD9193074.1 hypothetical protein [Aliivibrio sp. S2TY2]MDD9195778.1 hypothetical protein [Aliivibrio sp. S3MY1]